MPNTPHTSSRAAQFCVDNAKWIVALFAVASIALGWQARRFEINASAETLLTKGNQLYRQSLIVDRIFAPQEFLLIAYEPTKGDLFSEQTYEDLSAIAERIGTLERVESIRHLLNVPLVSLLEGEFSSDFDPDKLTLENLDLSAERLAEVFQGHPIYEDLLVNGDQSATAMQVSFKRNPELEEIRGEIVQVYEKAAGRELSEEELERIENLETRAKPLEKQLEAIREKEIESIRSVLADYVDHANLYLGGAGVLGYDLIKIVKRDLVVFGIAIALMVALVLFSLFRQLKWVVIPMICCVICVAITTGLFAVFGLKATVISANFITLQLILTLAIVIHLIVQYREGQAEHSDASPHDLAALALEKKAMPCFYAAATTSVGFASLMFSGIQPVNTFGLMMIVAMFVSTICSLLLFPALLVVMGKHSPKRDWDILKRLVKSLSSLAVGRGAWVIGGTTAFCVVCAAGLFRLTVENSFIDYFKESSLTHQELMFVDQNFGGSTPFDFIYELPPKEEGEKSLVLDADTVQAMQAVQLSLGESEGMGKALSVVNFAQLAKIANRDKPLTEYELSALYLAVDQELREELVGSYFSEDRNLARISFRVKDATEDLNRAALVEEIHTKIKAIGIDDSDYSLSGLFVMYQDLLSRLFRSQATTIGIVLVALLFCFVLVFRSLKIAFIALIPNIVSTVGILGIMGWLGIALDFMTITIASVAMGIAVDDTIHYVHRYLEERKNAEPDEAVKRAHRSVGMAVLYTTLIIVTGFLLLVFSNFVPSINFGLLTAISISLALLADLCLLPAVLLRVKA